MSARDIMPVGVLVVDMARFTSSRCSGCDTPIVGDLVAAATSADGDLAAVVPATVVVAFPRVSDSGRGDEETPWPGSSSDGERHCGTIIAPPPSLTDAPITTGKFPSAASSADDFVPILGFAADAWGVDRCGVMFCGCFRVITSLSDSVDKGPIGGRPALPAVERDAVRDDDTCAELIRETRLII